MSTARASTKPDPMYYVAVVTIEVAVSVSRRNVNTKEVNSETMRYFRFRPIAWAKCGEFDIRWVSNSQKS